MENSAGYRLNTKCTWVEAIEVYKELVESTRRDMQCSILCMGSYRLYSSLQHLEQNAVEWAKMSDSERRKHVDRLNLSLTTHDKTPYTTVINLTESDNEHRVGPKLPPSQYLVLHFLPHKTHPPPLEKTENIPSANSKILDSQHS